MSSVVIYQLWDQKIKIWEMERKRLRQIKNSAYYSGSATQGVHKEDTHNSLVSHIRILLQKILYFVKCEHKVLLLT